MFRWFRSGSKGRSPKLDSKEGVAEFIGNFVDYNTKLIERHEDPSNAERPHHLVSAELRPIIPLPRSHSARSWLGGCPRMPEAVAWPEQNGVPLQFLGQLDCSALPEGLWGGAGPRGGWLCFFAGWAPALTSRVIHVPELGPIRPAPAPRERAWMTLTMVDAPKDFDLSAPCWPVAVVSPEQAVVRDMPRDDELRDFRYPELDLENPLYRPSDWSSFALLLDLLQSSAEKMQTSMYADNARKAEAKRVTSALQKIADRVRETRDKTERFSQEAWREEIAYLGGLRELRSVRQSYAELRGWQLAQAYTQDPDRIDEPLRRHHERWWSLQSRRETPKLGGLTEGWSYELLENLDTHVMLLELPSSDLFGWVWGDLYSLLFIISRDDLERGNFDAVTCDITN